MQHFARLASSPRLQRALRVLREAKGEVSTWDLTVKARTSSVSSVISELRFNGCVINCRQAHEDGQRRFYYSLIKEPENDLDNR